MASLGTVTIRLQLTTDIGGPITLGAVDVPVGGDATAPAGKAALTIDQDVLRHEIACALIAAAARIDA
jgi:hypothetical protein